MSNDWVWDCETFPNVFTISFEHCDAPIRICFEISSWRNDSKEILSFFEYLRETNARMVGFNSIGFDYPIAHMLLKMGQSDANTLYQKAMSIIGTQDMGDERWTHQVFPSDRVVPQLDLFKIHHFDNKARATSLKVLEFNMKSESIEDLPFPVGTELTREQVPVLKHYNAHDVTETKKFLKHTLPMIKFREELMVKYPGRDWLNFNDTKIGKEYFVMRLEEAGVPCYEFGPQGRKPRQTPRPVIHLRDAILPWIEFENVEFQRILNWLREQSITETKGAIKGITASVGGIEFVFGTGGIHGSMEKKVIESNDQFIIVDIDVESYYPSTGIAQRFRPEHFPEVFCDIYSSLKTERVSFKKGTAENAMLKLALNGVFGDTGNKFSPFYDPLYMMKITLNGQLLLCKLAEDVLNIFGLSVIQANTDGLTLRVPRNELHRFNLIVEQWEKLVNLKMEHNYYRTMFIRDVNSYIAVYEDGKIKRKGAYEWKPVTEPGGTLGWHQNHSALVVPKVAEQFLVHGKPIRETIENWPDLYDFMLRTKVPRSSYLTIEHDGKATQIQNTCRYYIAKGGGRLFKWMPPLKGKQEWRRIGVESGWGVQVCNRLSDAGRLPIDVDYYVREVEKLVIGLE